jgi:HK97 gp10 family phage protein
MGFASIEIGGLAGKLDELRAMASGAEAAAGRVMLKLAQRVAEEAKREITARHASARGTPPDSRTGDLVNSITAEMAGPTTSQVRADAGHARYLEYGTRKMAPRPFLRLAVATAQPGFSLPAEFAAEIAVDSLRGAAASVGEAIE